jgi:hypothetical protein
MQHRDQQTHPGGDPPSMPVFCSEMAEIVANKPQIG